MPKLDKPTGVPKDCIFANKHDQTTDCCKGPVYSARVTRLIQSISHGESEEKRCLECKTMSNAQNSNINVGNKFHFIYCAVSAGQHDRDNGVRAWGNRFSQT